MTSIFLFFPLLVLVFAGSRGPAAAHVAGDGDDSPVFIWPLPESFRRGNRTLIVDPDLVFVPRGAGAGSSIVAEAFQRCLGVVSRPWLRRRSRTSFSRNRKFDVTELTVFVGSDDETLQLGVDESYEIYVGGDGTGSIIHGAAIEANTVYGAIRAIETFSQLCVFNSASKSIQIKNAPWYIQDSPRFAFRGLLLDTSRHYLPIKVIKQVIDSMSYAKLNVLHWHIIDEQSFPLEVPSYPKLWNGSYSRWERYTTEDASDVVDFAMKRGIHVMAEIDVPGHAASWGSGYPNLRPSFNCTEPLDVTKESTFELITGILSDMRKIFPFDLFHLGGDEVNTDCWNSTEHVTQWLQDHNMTTKDAYGYFVLRAQEIAINLNWNPVNWEETFNSFQDKLNPQTVVHNWWGPGVCPKAVDKGFRCIVSNQDVWYLDHITVPWEHFYNCEPLEGINNTTQQKLVLGGEVCMWGEMADASDIQQTIWPRAAAAAERLWSPLQATTVENLNITVLPRLHQFRCLLNSRGIAAAPVVNSQARMPPFGPGSCFDQ